MVARLSFLQPLTLATVVGDMATMGYRVSVDRG
jgi:hypothetical protein